MVSLILQHGNRTAGSYFTFRELVEYLLDM